MTLSVAGKSLKKVLSRGVREKMDKAMMYLVQKSTAGTVDRDQAGPSKPSHSVSLELLDESGKVIVNEAGNDTARDEVVEVGT